MIIRSFNLKFLFILYFFLMCHCCFAEANNKNRTAEDINSPEYFVKQGNFYSDQNKVQEAVLAYQEAIAFDPNIAEAHLGLGMGYGKLKKYDEAIKELKLAMQIDTALSKKAIPYLIFVYLFKNDTKDADYFRKLFVLDKQAAQGIYPHIFYSRIFGLKETEDGFETVMILSPKIEDAIKDDALKADNLYHKGQVVQAIEEYRKILGGEISTKSKAAVCNIIGSIYVHSLSKPLEAIPYLERAIKLNPNEAALRISLVNAYRLMNNYTKALEETEKMLDIDATNKFALFSRGAIYFKIREWQKAIANWGKLKRVDTILFALIEEQYNTAKAQLTNRPTPK